MESLIADEAFIRSIQVVPLLPDDEEEEEPAVTAAGQGNGRGGVQTQARTSHREQYRAQGPNPRLQPAMGRPTSGSSRRQDARPPSLPPIQQVLPPSNRTHLSQDHASLLPRPPSAPSVGIPSTRRPPFPPHHSGIGRPSAGSSFSTQRRTGLGPSPLSPHQPGTGTSSAGLPSLQRIPPSQRHQHSQPAFPASSSASAVPPPPNTALSASRYPRTDVASSSVPHPGTGPGRGLPPYPTGEQRQSARAQRAQRPAVEQESNESSAARVRDRLLGRSPPTSTAPSTSATSQTSPTASTTTTSTINPALTSISAMPLSPSARGHGSHGPDSRHPPQPSLPEGTDADAALRAHRQWVKELLAADGDDKKEREGEK